MLAWGARGRWFKSSHSDQINKRVSEFLKPAFASNSTPILKSSILKPKVEFALEGYQVVSEKLTTLEEKIDNLTVKVDSNDVQIAVLKGSKTVAK